MRHAPRNPARALPQHRHHGPHRCRQDHHHRAHPLLHRQDYKIGEVHDGTTTMDWMVQERERGITITSAATTALLERPRHQHHRHARATWTSPSRWSARCACSTVPSRCSTGSTASSRSRETVWRQADRYGVPRICFINKMDRIGADFDRCVSRIRERLGANAVAVQLPSASRATQRRHRPGPQ